MIDPPNVHLLSKSTLLVGATALVIAFSSLAQAQQRFQTPEAAIEALVAAARSGDRKIGREHPRPGLAGARLLRRPRGG